jgi:hypothetical protein
VKTSGGSIRIGKVAGEVKAITSGGSIKVKEVKGTINAKTSGGSVTAYISEQPEGDCSLTTSGGSVSAHLAGNIKVYVDAKTSGGTAHSDFSIDGEKSKRKIRGKINGGGPELYLRTSGGGVKIYKTFALHTSLPSTLHVIPRAHGYTVEGFAAGEIDPGYKLKKRVLGFRKIQKAVFNLNTCIPA